MTSQLCEGWFDLCDQVDVCGEVCRCEKSSAACKLIQRQARPFASGCLMFLTIVGAWSMGGRNVSEIKRAVCVKQRCSDFVQGEN